MEFTLQDAIYLCRMAGMLQPLQPPITWSSRVSDNGHSISLGIAAHPHRDSGETKPFSCEVQPGQPVPNAPEMAVLTYPAQCGVIIGARHNPAIHEELEHNKQAVLWLMLGCCEIIIDTLDEIAGDIMAKKGAHGPH